MNKLPFVCALLWMSPALADDDDHETKEGEGALSENGGRFSLLSKECKADEDSLETTRAHHRSTSTIRERRVATDGRSTS